MTDTMQIEHAARQVATAEDSLREATDLHRQRRDEVSAVERRIGEAERRRDQTRAAATADPDDSAAAGRYALALADLEDLNHLLAEARRAADEAAPGTAEAVVQSARRYLIDLQGRAELEALQAHIREVEGTLVEAVREAYQIGQRVGAGRQLSSVWQPTAELDRACRLGQVPGITGLAIR